MADLTVKEIFDALPPTGQLVFGIATLVVGTFLSVMGLLESRRKSAVSVAVAQPADQSSRFPSWIMYGPMHDAMQSIHEIAEQSRIQVEQQKLVTAELRDVAKGVDRINRGQEYTHRLMEEVLRGQVLHRQAMDMPLRPPSPPS